APYLLTSDIRRLASGFQPLRRIHRRIGDDDVGAGAAHGEEAFQSDGAFVDPAVGGGGFDHGMFGADGIRGGGVAKFRFDAMQNVQVREGGFDYDDVGAFLDVEGDF